MPLVHCCTDPDLTGLLAQLCIPKACSVQQSNFHPLKRKEKKKKRPVHILLWEDMYENNQQVHAVFSSCENNKSNEKSVICASINFNFLGKVLFHGKAKLLVRSMS